MSIGIRQPVISLFSFQLSWGSYAIFPFHSLFPITFTWCVPLTPLPLNGARSSFVRGGLVQQLLPFLLLHPPPLPLLLWVVWLWMRSWRNFSAWILALIHSLLSCIRWTPVSVVLLDGRLPLVALWSLPLLLPRHLRHPRTMMTLTTMIMMMRMEMLALPTLTRCLLDTLTLCYLWQKGRAVLIYESSHT